MLKRNLSSLPIPPKYLTKLDEKGYKTARDLIDTQPLEIAKDMGISNQEALDLWKLASPPDCQSSRTTASSTALEIFSKRQNVRGIVTFCRALDHLLSPGNGFPSGEVTEVCGQPGIGKTQIAIQAAVNATIPRLLGGVGGAAVYIDTEGSFVVERVRQIARRLVADLRAKTLASERKKADNADSSARLQAARSYTEEHILKNIHYFRVFNYSEQIAVINSLQSFLAAHTDVRVVIVDSISCHFRQGFEDMALRTRILASMGQKLHSYANHNNVAVVLTNQVTTKISKATGPTLVPALGEGWGHVCTNRLVIQWPPHANSGGRNDSRIANLTKSATRRPGEAEFRVVAAGIRDVDVAPASRSDDARQPALSKRPRLGQ
mgnify:CR=1 FL=1